LPATVSVVPQHEAEPSQLAYVLHSAVILLHEKWPPQERMPAFRSVYTHAICPKHCTGS